MRNRTRLLAAAVLLAAVWVTAREGVCMDIYKNNSHYWAYKGKPVLLLGGSDEDNLFNNPQMMMDNFAILKRIGGNYIRGTLSCRDEGNVWPYEQVNGKYDLTRFNPEFWDRLERCCKEAEARDIIVQIEVWATFDYYRDNWLVNPFNPNNNVNYTTENTKLAPEWNFHPAQKPQPFFHSPPGLNDDKVLRGFQDAFVRKVLDTTLPYPNVLYCLDNETKAPKEWPWYWGEFIREEAKKRGVTIHVTEMWDDWDLTQERHANTYTRPDIFDFTDVSQNNWQVGQTHYDRLMWYRENLTKQPGGVRPMNNVKVYGLARPRKGVATDVNLDRWWQNIWAGCAGTRFHRPGGGIGLNADAQQAIRAARTFTDAFDIFSCAPRPELLSDREENEAYCLANAGTVYALYFPKGGRVTLSTKDAEKELTLRWFDVSTCKFGQAHRLGKTDAVALRSPNEDHAWLALVE